MSITAIPENPAPQAATTKAAPAAKKDIRPPKPLPAPNSDFYELAETLPAEELAVVKQVRAFMETKVAPIINQRLHQPGSNGSFSARKSSGHREDHERADG